MGKASVYEKAMVLVESTRRAVEAGVKHYDVNGKLLGTPKEILTALRRDGKIVVDASGSKQ